MCGSVTLLLRGQADANLVRPAQRIGSPPALSPRLITHLTVVPCEVSVIFAPSSGAGNSMTASLTFMSFHALFEN